jgi:hypothetical protein
VGDSLWCGRIRASVENTATHAIPGHIQSEDAYDAISEHRYVLLTRIIISLFILSSSDSHFVASNDQLAVSDIQLGRVLACFGPWHALAQNIHAIASQKWFFGTLSKRKVQSVLHRGLGNGTFLVRQASHPASFAVHYIDGEKLVQCLVRREWNEAKYVRRER